MKRSRIRTLTALASVALCMTLLSSPAQALSWSWSESWLSADLFSAVRSWLTGLDSGKDVLKPISAWEKTTAASSPKDDKDNRGVQPAGDDGVCLDPGGNRVPCAG
jgi:hypothetical protein